ncbi:MAG: trypsin-like peptidase domain-containing protein [Candidatus Pacearchaeota archaeon]
MAGKYKKHHIAIVVYVFIFKILIISSLIYIAYSLVELRKDLEMTRQTQIELENQLYENQKAFQSQIQSQINEIGDSLLSVKKNFNEEIALIKASSSADFSSIIENVIPSVVSIGTDISQGSGFIITSDGYIVTNAHVLEGGRYVRVLLYQNNRWIPAEFIGYDENFDIAILKISGENYDSLRFDDSSNIKVGEKAIALGNPLGLSFSVTEGIISALHREGPNKVPAYLQIDVPLNPGNSGGPLINKKGKVIGINNFKIRNSENLGFALESNYVVEVINNIFELNNQTIRITN